MHWRFSKIFFFFQESIKFYIRSENHMPPIVNILHQILDNSIKIAAENLYSVLLLMIKRISHTSLFTNVTKILKKFSKIKNHTYTLHKSLSIPKYFSNKLTKTPLRGHKRGANSYCYQIRIQFQLAIQRPFCECLECKTFLKTNSNATRDVLGRSCS